MPTPALSRRDFIAFIASIAPIGRLGGRVRQGPHPDPRPGVDGSHVLTAERLAETPDLIPLFDGIREIPEVADGIRCRCGCSAQLGRRSLLTCFEEDGMAVECRICQGEARIAIRMRREGQGLQQIRDAIDERY